MTSNPRLDLILGPEQAARLIRQYADDIAHQDQIPPDTALRLACERASDGDPLLLAAPGQVWTMKPDPSDSAPAESFVIHGRLAAPPRILVRYADEPQPNEIPFADLPPKIQADLGDTSVQGNHIVELPLQVLQDYQIEAWQPVDALLDGDLR